MQGGRLTIFGVAFAAATLAGCGESERFAGQACLPLEAPSPESAPMRSVEPAALDFYVDVSLSMPAFGLPDQADGFAAVPYRNVLAALMANQGRTSDTRLLGVAETVEVITEDAVRSLASGAPRCVFGAGKCQETRLNLALEDIAAHPDRTAVLVSDLWFRNDEVFGSSTSALARPLREIVAQGRAVGVLGFTAPFQGMIYDMPGAPRTLSSQGVRYRPLFAVIIGEPAEVAHVRDMLERDAFFGADSVEREFTLFASNPFAAGPGVLMPELDRATGVASRSLFLPEAASQAEQITLNTGALNRAIRDSVRETGRPDPGAVTIAARMDMSGRLWPGAASGIGEVRLEGEVLASPRRREDYCSPDLWDRSTSHAGAELGEAQIVGQSLEATLYLAGDSWRAADGDRLYLVRYSVVAAPGRPETPAWMERWSFSSSDHDRLVADPPEFFPALNLSGLGVLLNDAVRSEAEVQPLGSGALLIELN